MKRRMLSPLEMTTIIQSVRAHGIARAHQRDLKTILADEAWTLHDAISDAYWKEANTRQGTHQPDTRRLARLGALKCKAADRWRRRMGYQPIYTGRTLP